MKEIFDGPTYILLAPVLSQPQAPLTRVDPTGQQYF